MSSADESTGGGTAELRGWGRATVSASRVHQPNQVSALPALISNGGQRGVLPRGLGRSYGDAALNAGGDVVVTTDLNRIGTVGSNGEVTVEAGVSIHELVATLVPQGWFVPVTPGTRQVTVGGAIAADIHGKNHHLDGSFGQHVSQLELVVPSGEVIVCSPDTNPDAFWCTVGGMGLTGVVQSATIKMKPIQSSKLLVDTDQIDNIDALLETLLAEDHKHAYSVAWVDLLARGKKLGRSVLTRGRFANADEATTLDFAAGPSLPTPGIMPSGLLNLASLKTFNQAWFMLAPKHRTGELQSIGRFFHPLDGVRNWNLMYGPRGFLQWQILLPDHATGCLRSVVQQLSDNRVPSFLTVLKRFGPANPAPLSFPDAGWTLTADVPVGSAELGTLLDHLDEQVVEHGGRVYLAKDSRMRPELLPAMYPRLDEWRQQRDLLDPQRRMSSDLSRRLNLLG